MPATLAFVDTVNLLLEGTLPIAGNRGRPAIRR